MTLKEELSTEEEIAKMKRLVIKMCDEVEATKQVVGKLRGELTSLKARFERAETIMPADKCDFVPGDVV